MLRVEESPDFKPRNGNMSHEHTFGRVKHKGGEDAGQDSYSNQTRDKNEDSKIVLTLNIEDKDFDGSLRRQPAELQGGKNLLNTSATEKLGTS